MKKQVLYIHGATAFSDYKKFLEWLRTCEASDPLAERPGRWPDTLRSELGEDFEVYMPSMPNKQNAKYEEWKIWFERYFTFLRDGAVLIGWSQGGYFLLKYLSENAMPVAIKALYLLAAPTGPDDFGGEDGGDFTFKHEEAKNISKNVERIFIFHSKDDPVVPFSHAEKLQELLPEAESVIFEDKGHFLEERFPELTEHVRGIFGRS